MPTWDRRTAQQQHSVQARALQEQVLHAVGPFSPYWRERLAALGRTASSVATPAGLATVPPVGERDVCPDGDPAGAARLVLQAGEAGWALHAEGPRLRQGLVRRVLSPRGYRAVVEADTRPTSFVTGGHGVRFPVASTRSDLDVVARAGARLWQVLGLTRADVLVAALPLGRTAQLQALELGALGSGSPALFPGDDPDEVADTLRLVAATVLAVPAGDAGRRLDDLDEAGARLSSLRTVLLVGSPGEQERAEAEAALDRAGLSARVLAVHVAEGHRLAWGECAAGSGLHTYPDLELLQLVDPETLEPVEQDGEVVLTQLGLHGTALLRWRTGDLARRLEGGACPGCGRTVPRLLEVRPAALVPTLALRTGARAVDLRGLTAALAGRADLADWCVVVGRSPRDGADEVLVHVVPRRDVDPSDVAVAVARDVRSAAGLLPTQIVVDDVLPEGRSVAGRVLARA